MVSLPYRPNSPQQMTAATAKEKPSFVRRWTWRLLYGLYLILMVCVLLEIGLRLRIGYDPGYYMGFGQPKPDTVIEYPYGEIRFNHDGYPDDDWLAGKTKPRIAYLGDSVCYGVGAGHGYRVTEVLEEKLPQYEHMNFGHMASSGIRGSNVDRILKMTVKPYRIDQVVYLMNLNDILPDLPDAKAYPKVGNRYLRAWLDELRGKSYLYTYLRTAGKNFYARQGYGHTGLFAFERWPVASEKVVRSTAERVNGLHRALKKRGVRFLVVLLPYEMQISVAAESRYSELGIQWEDGFIDRGAQKALMAAFDDDLEVVDAYFAFVGHGRTREENGLGQLFVYNRGDKWDWNHPNREGHRLIANYLFAQKRIGP